MSGIQIHHINKSFNKGKVQALTDISFTVRPGELFGLIGPDGAGKTTLFRILTTLWLADSGSANVNGLDVIKDYAAIRKIIGYMPGKFSLYQDLTVEENLQFFATLFHTSIEKNYELIKDIYIQLEPFKTRKAGKLSGGMKQKLALCCALIHKPQVLFLDEPTTGVDPVSRKEFWEMLKRLQKELTIVVSTPYMDEANLCDRIALIQKGHILQIDKPAAIIQAFDKKLFAVKSSNMHRLISDVRNLPEVNSCFGFGDYLHVTTNTDSTDENHLIAAITAQQHTDIEVKIIQPEIEDCFMALMEKE
ncbi:MAG TPA: ABC transporter ATP-binding protein [Chitinophagales bacterium]|nr:ABC transporter ATP-binding protein [Chitinophagales bacterium]HRG84265.1 ABC transporter ATP-binding protein [Chitinophagales bacterium]HRH53729.1 ABC transporter ATP-binding protein [Chitinophagales bacterium]